MLSQRQKCPATSADAVKDAVLSFVEAQRPHPCKVGLNFDAFSGHLHSIELFYLAA